MPQVDKFPAAGVALVGVSEDFFRFQVKESHAHGTVAHDAFQMTYATAATIAFFRVESDGDMSALPHSLDVRPAAIPDAVSDGPDAGKPVKVATGSSHSGGNGVGVVGHMHWGGDAAGC